MALPINANSAIIDTNQDAQFVQLNNRSLAEIISGGNNVQVYQSKDNVYVEAIQISPTQQFISQSVNNPGGSDYQVQFNLNGEFTGASAFTYNYQTGILNAPIISGNLTTNANGFKLYGGTNGQFLQTDGLGNVDWANTPASGNITVAGVSSQLQFNDGGQLGASTSLSFNKDNNTLLTNNFTSTGNVFFAGSNTRITGNLNITGTNTVLGSINSIHIYGGQNGQVLQTDGTGNLGFTNINMNGAMTTYYSGETNTELNIATNSDINAVLPANAYPKAGDIFRDTTPLANSPYNTQPIYMWVPGGNATAGGQWRQILTAWGGN